MCSEPLTERGEIMVKTSHRWAAIRLTDGIEWIDLEIISYEAFEAEQKAEIIDKEIPLWAKENPVRYAAKIQISLG
jgi:hypothetical protein